VKPVASIIHSSEFLHWRMTGVAFQFGDGKYSFPNKSTETSIKGISKKSGTTKLVKGYWADILIGPFISFGIACDQVDEPTQKLFQVINKGSGAEQHRHNATDISLYNVISLMWELQVSTPN
jgi:dynein assembly factor 3